MYVIMYAMILTRRKATMNNDHTALPTCKTYSEVLYMFSIDPHKNATRMELFLSLQLRNWRLRNLKAQKLKVVEMGFQAY